MRRGGPLKTPASEEPGSPGRRSRGSRLAKVSTLSSLSSAVRSDATAQALELPSFLAVVSRLASTDLGRERLLRGVRTVVEGDRSADPAHVRGEVVQEFVHREAVAALGVPHYWTLDPDAETLECLRLQGNAYRSIAETRAPEMLVHPDWPDLRIRLGALWR